MISKIRNVVYYKSTNIAFYVFNVKMLKKRTDTPVCATNAGKKICRDFYITMVDEKFRIQHPVVNTVRNFGFTIGFEFKATLVINCNQIIEH